MRSIRNLRRIGSPIGSPKAWLVPVLGPVLAAAAASSIGCRSLADRPPPVTVEKVVELTREGKEPGEIISRIDESRTIYELDARDVWRLIEDGVEESVVDHMLETRIRDLRDRLRYYRNYPLYYGPYPYSPFHFHFGFGHRYRYYH